MPTGFIYVVTSVTRRYEQGRFSNVPTAWQGRLYFGPCKTSMRSKVQHGDYLFGVSPSSTSPRRIVFAAKIDERITFAEAYHRFPHLRGPDGPIHVCPLKVKRNDSFPRSDYEHIPDSIHADKWQGDLASPELDAFFVCSAEDGIVGRWLGERGPEVDEIILELLKTCSVHGRSGLLSEENRDATVDCPIVHWGERGRLCTGLHLETNEPERLLALCTARADPDDGPLDPVPRILPSKDRKPEGGARRKSCARRSTSRA